MLAELRAADTPRLHEIVTELPGLLGARIEDDTVIIELQDDDLAPVNRFVAERGVSLSHLALRQRSLEDVFMEVLSHSAES